VSSQTAVSDIRALIDVVRRKEVPFLAAAIAYYAFLSVVPLLIVGVTVATVVAGQSLATDLIESSDTFLTPEAGALVQEALVEAPGRGGVTAVGLLVLLWSGLRVFRGIDAAFSRVYGRSELKPLAFQLRDALLVLLGIGLALAGTVALGMAFSLLDIPLAGFGGTLALIVVLTVVFFPMYYVFPSRPVTVREAVPGAAFAGIGWAALGAGFGIYASNAGSLQLYGVLAGVLLLLVWFYFGGLILLVGAAVNVVFGNTVEDRQLQQEGLRGHSQRASMTEDSGPTDGADDSDGGRDGEGGRTAPGEPTATDDAGTDESPTEGDPAGAAEIPTGREDPDVSARITQEDIDDLRREIDEIETRLEEGTVHRDEIERDLKKYVRGRVRRGHATGWGPYLVLLYGTAMTLGAFFFLGGGWAILAMLVVWLSTLGLYALMLIVGVTVKGVRMPGRILEKVRGLR
jgi:YihY family inner membrane protein